MALTRIQHLERQIERVSNRLGDAAAEANYFRAYGRTMQQDIASWRAEIAEIRRQTTINQKPAETGGGGGGTGVPEDIKKHFVPTHTPFVPATGVAGMERVEEIGGGIAAIFQGVGNILAALPRAMAAVGGVIQQLFPIIIQFLPVVAIVSMLYAVSAIFRIRVKVG